MKENLRILILEDHASDAELMEWELKRAGLTFTSRRVEARDTFEAALAEFHPDLVLSDYTLPGYNGKEAIEYAKRSAPDVPVIVVTGTIGEENAVEMLKAGAKDYVLKDRMARLPSAIERALAEVESAKAIRESERRLRESEAHFRNTLEHAPIGIMVIALDGRFIEVNQSLCDFLGYTKRELMRLPSQEIIHPDDREETLEGARRLLAREVGSYKRENRYLRRDGTPVWGQVTASLLWDSMGVPLNFIGQVEDITERKRAQEEIRQLAYYDTLTGLPNRRLLQDRLGQALAMAKRRRHSVAVMFLDLDNFKEVNDTLGHDAGDELLREVAQRLTSCIRGGDTVSRQGGDEFVIVLSEIAHQQDAARVAEKVMDLFEQPFAIQGRALKITTSIGIAVHAAEGGDDGAQLMKHADIAMYQAKQAGRNSYRFYPVVGEIAKEPGAVGRAVRH